MPLTVRKFNAQVKDPQSGQMVPAGLLSSDSLQAIEAAETAAITEIQQKGAETKADIPDDYTELSESVGELKESLSDLSNDWIRTLPWTIGGYQTVTPFEVIESLKRICSTQINDAPGRQIIISADTGYQFSISFWNADGSYRSNIPWRTEAYTFGGTLRFTLRAKRESAETNLSSVDELLSHLHSDYFVGEFHDLENRVTEIENVLPETVNSARTGIGIPDYSLQEYNTCLSKMLTYLPSTIAAFGFSTDQHVTYLEPDDTQKQNLNGVTYGLRVMSMLSRMIPLNVICLGGDAAGYDTTQGEDDTQEGVLADVQSVLRPLYDAWSPVVQIAGNHDAFQNLRGNSLPVLTGEQIMRNYIGRAVSDHDVTLGDRINCNCFFDDPRCNIRYIFIGDQYNDANGGSESSRSYSAQFLAAALLDTQNGGTRPVEYKVITFSHRCLAAGAGFTDEQGNPVSMGFDKRLYNPDDTSLPIVDYRQTIICCISGHGHKDESGVWENMLFIGTTCAQKGSDPNREYGTVSESAFDMFMVDADNRRIHAIRGGYGSDREFIYGGSDAGEVVNP